jgi:hypothetical protein
VAITDGIYSGIMQTFSVVVINERPRFQTTPRNLSIPAGSFEKIFLPDVLDPEGAPITVTCTNAEY